MPVACFLVTKTMAHPFVIDSVKINHTTDGNINEWRADKFEMDKETQILYSVDHDANNLYVALKVLDPKMQMRMVMQGMSMYLDKNGKKKERMGVEFPVRRDAGSLQMMNRGDRSKGTPGQEGAPDPKEMRQKMSAAMIFLKTFGFDDQEEAKTQFIGEPNGVNVAFTWDDANNMYIEYQVPMSMLGTPAALNGKPLGIGWKLHAMETSLSSSNALSTSSQVVGVPAGTSPGGGRNSGAGGTSSRAGGRSNTAPFTSDAGFREQSLWTKYVLTF